MQRVAVARRFVFGEARAQLHRHRRSARHMELLGEDVRGFRKGCGGRGSIAEMRVDEEIAGRPVVKLRRVGRERGFDIDGERQRLVIDPHRFRRIPRLSLGLRDNHRDGLADMADALDREQLVRADENGTRRAAIGGGKLHVEFRRRHGIMRDGFQPVCAAIGAGEDSEHAGHGARRIGIDARDTRMRMRRAHESGEDLARDAEIVGIAAMAGQQPEILFPRQRLAAMPQGEAFDRIHQPSFTGFSRPSSA